MIDKKIEILGIPFTTFHETQLLEYIQKQHKSEQKKALFIATPNPEILLATEKNSHLKTILQNTDINIPDGNGIIWAYRYLKFTNKNYNKLILAIKWPLSLLNYLFSSKNSSKKFQKTIHGSDLAQNIIRNPQLNSSIFLLGNKDGLAPDTAKQVAQKLTDQGIKVAGFLDSSPSEKNILEKINHSKAKILLVGFGSPAQEIWLAENLHKLSHIKVAMGIGGTFDFIAGILPRAPQWMRKIGLEWVFRLIKQPKRIRRIINAFIIFPLHIVKAKMTNPQKYKISDI